MESENNKIIFNEIKTYEQAYYYNSDPSDRIEYSKEENKTEKKKYKFKNSTLKGVGKALGEVIEFMFSMLD